MTAVSISIAGGRGSRLVAAAWFASYAALPCHRAARRGIPVRDWWRIPAAMALKDGSMLCGALLGLRDALRHPR
jgi:hypothetical protein